LDPGKFTGIWEMTADESYSIRTRGSDQIPKQCKLRIVWDNIVSLPARNLLIRGFSGKNDDLTTV